MYSKRNHKQNGTKPTDGEKIFASDLTHKGLISRIYKQLIKFKKTKPVKKQEYINRHFSEDIQMAKRRMERCLLLLLIRKMQIKTTMMYQLIQIRLPSLKISTNNKMLERVWRNENLHALLAGMQTGKASMENSMEVP